MERVKIEEGPGDKLEKLSDLDSLYEPIINGLRYVLLGKASHGISEFYNWCIEIKVTHNRAQLFLYSSRR